MGQNLIRVLWVMSQHKTAALSGKRRSGLYKVSALRRQVVVMVAAVKLSVWFYFWNLSERIVLCCVAQLWKGLFGPHRGAVTLSVGWVKKNVQTIVSKTPNTEITIKKKPKQQQQKKKQNTRYQESLWDRVYEDKQTSQKLPLWSVTQFRGKYKAAETKTWLFEKKGWEEGAARQEHRDGGGWVLF